MGAIEEELDQGDGQGFDSFGRRVGFAPGLVKAAESEVDFVVPRGVAGILGPHPCESLAHQGEDV